MKHEEMEKRIREAIVSYHKETGRFVLRVSTEWLDRQIVRGERSDILNRLEIITTDRTP